jgi:K+:H+ antiporter
MERLGRNIGYDLGILSAPMYTMMVIMALATTCMAGPVLALIPHVRYARASADLAP